MDNIILGKVESIERCLKRVREEYRIAGKQFESDYTHQDAAILNILRACEQAIDLANYIVKKKHLGLPQNSRDSFELLRVNHIIDAQLEQRMKSMVGFRNIAVHNYSNLNIEIVIAIIEGHLDDFKLFANTFLGDDKK